jgi:hypothetical protein
LAEEDDDDDDDDDEDDEDDEEEEEDVSGREVDGVPASDDISVPVKRGSCYQYTTRNCNTATCPPFSLFNRSFPPLQSSSLFENDFHRERKMR